jgi:hypothetical protein
MNCKIRDSKLNILQAGGLILARSSQRLRRAGEIDSPHWIERTSRYFPQPENG